MSTSSPRLDEGSNQRLGLVWFALIAVSILWGTMGIATQAALRDGLAPYTLTALRMTVASAILIMYLVASRTRILLSRHFLSDGLIMALGQVVLPSVLFAAALQRLPAGAVCLFFALVPAATALWMRIFLRAALGRRASLGLGLAMAGTVLVALNTPEAVNSSDSGFGIGLILGAVLVASLHGIYAKRHAGHPLFEVIAPQILIGTFLLVATGFFAQAIDWQGLSLGTWAVVAYLAIGVTVVPAVVLWWLFKRASAMKVALVNYLFPLVALAVGVIWFGERFSEEFVIGGLVLLAGVALVETGVKGMPLAGVGLRPCPDTGGLQIKHQTTRGDGQS